jgi:predicted enzyme related to lactoylglutathione lyase
LNYNRYTHEKGWDMNASPKINYLELPASDLEKTKVFFSQVFDWQFTDYGPEYIAFDQAAGLDGGFYLSDQSAKVVTGSVLVIFYSDDLDHTQAKVEAVGGQISQAIFAFPGGRRFHFLDPNGNEFAVWSE